MTQIKLRRDTSANFTSKNPVLGIGEPAYETDTKKLKIGDGITAYTQLEYFSAGGGGSTDIAATLPLKIVDGVISLEVDGQTIQIVDGKLHANLDELGNEVNSLTGEVTDLSGRVTAAEANLDKKENKITTTGALSLQEKIISNLTNMTETETQITPNKNQPFVVDSSEFYFSGTTYNAPQCYIAIPYQFGQWLKIPGGHNTQPAVFFGHFLEDGDFLITAVFSGDCYERNYPIYGGIVRDRAPVSFATYSDTFYLNSYGSVSEKAVNSNIIFTETDPCAYLQLIDNTSSGNIICGSYNYGYGPNSSGIKGYAETHVVYNRDLTNYTVQDFVRDTTTALIMSPYTDKPILKSAVGLYAATGRLGWNQDGYNQLKANLGENLFDLTKSQVNNYLELNLGDGLSVVDGKLTASSTAPANMVTTDTAQTITGQKEFNHTILSLNQDLIRGQQSTSYRNGAGLSMGSNSTSTDGGVFAPQWRIYSTTGDVDRTETIMTTYNQSKLNASNFNTANKLVRLDSSGKLPAIDGSQLTNLPGGSSEPPANMVTTDTTQTISGDKEFTGITTISNDIKLTIGKKITTPDGQWLMQLGTGFIGIGTSIRPLTTYDSSNYYLHNKSVIAGDGIKITEPSIGEIQISSTIGNMAAYVTEEFIDGTEGYRVWSNGRGEQWGSFNGAKSITFLKNYVDTNYTLLLSVVSKTSNEAYNGVFGTTKNATGFTASGFAGTVNDAWIITAVGTCNWYTSGVLAS